ncbi:hypothetical protein [Staphylococcus gallinarum]|uniref:hypothetical protein n=1 Tax=Staphylococcus gallinarum TaxID=1293 RepID=UPI001E5449CA|nr:hypothetical protein [Staphylococcus gallinarum]MCD8787453.1 hypothetical protein [Staphylococcus gallinarum]MCD8845260.1 hypothetical protein [Staphylococcus gallinarum]
MTYETEIYLSLDLESNHDDKVSELVTDYIIQESLTDTFTSHEEAIKHLLMILKLFPRLKQEDVEDLAMFFIHRVQEDN